MLSDDTAEHARLRVGVAPQCDQLVVGLYFEEHAFAAEYVLGKNERIVGVVRDVVLLASSNLGVAAGGMIGEIGGVASGREEKSRRRSRLSKFDESQSAHCSLLC